MSAANNWVDALSVATRRCRCTRHSGFFDFFSWISGLFCSVRVYLSGRHGHTSARHPPKFPSHGAVVSSVAAILVPHVRRAASLFSKKKKGRGRPIERFQLPVRNSSAEEKPPSRNQVRLISPFKTVAPTNGRGLAFGGRALIDDWQSLQMNSIHWQKSRKELEAEPRKSLRSLRNGISQAKKVTWITDHG